MSISLLTFTTSSAYAAPKTAWRIDYDAGLVSGRSTVYATADAIKIETGIFDIIAKAPDWKADFVNKNLKKRCEIPMVRWEKEGFFLDPPAAGYMVPKSAFENEKIKFGGMNCKRMAWRTIESDDFFQARSKPRKTVIELIQDQGGIPLSKPQLKLMSVWYGCPFLTGVPLFWQNIASDPKTKKSEVQVRIKARGIGKVPASSVSWQPKKGCHLELSAMNLVDKRITNTLTDFIEVEDELSRSKERTKSR